LMPVTSTGGRNHPLRGWGRTPQAGSPTPTPRGFAREVSARPNIPIRRRRSRTARHQTAVVFHHSSQPEKETTHG
jgi:hypothetical protein